MISRTRQTFDLFWRSYPALGCACATLLGVIYQVSSPWTLIPLAALIIFSSIKRSLLFSILFCLASLGEFYHSLQSPHFNDLKGDAHLSISSIKKVKSGWIYRGELKDFTSATTRSLPQIPIPCTVFSKIKYDLNQQYLIHGTLKETKAHHAIIKTTENWTPLKKTFNLASLRYRGKNQVSAYIENVIAPLSSSHLLIGLITGDCSNPFLQKLFQTHGLSHLLAISGFHFACVAFSFHLFLRLFFPYHINALLLITLLTLYFLFIGNTPSVQRAWITSTLFFLGSLIKKRASGLNSLGVALLVGLIIDSSSILNIGFQLSFLATGAILLITPLVDRALYFLIPKASIFSWARNTLALSLSVHLTLMPLLFYHFHQVPLHGFFYNLFFPFLITISMALLIFGSLIHLTIPPLGIFIHHAHSFYLGKILPLLDRPLCPHVTLYALEIQERELAIFLTVIIGSAIYMRMQKRLAQEDFSLLF